ncbi:MAG: dihydrofolate reductase family protein, partial [Calditrichota bacterium]
PKLTTRLTEGQSPRAIVLDSNLRIPVDAALFNQSHLEPWIITAADSPSKNKERIRETGAKIFEINRAANGKLDIEHLLKLLAIEGIRVLMVEGGQQVITDFLYRKSVNEILVTITPTICSGLNAIESGVDLTKDMFRISGKAEFGSDLVIRLCRRGLDAD